jgi:chromosome segregation ATPase
MPENIEIQISANASEAVSAGQQTAGALEKIGKAAAKASTETQAAATSIEKIEPASVDAAAATSKIGTAAQEASVKTRDLKEIFRTLGQEIPALGMAGRFLNPLVGMVATLVAGLSTFKRGMDDAIQRMNTGVWKGSFRQSVEEIGNATRESELALHAFRRSLDAVTNSEQSLKEKTTAAIAAIHDQAAAQASLQDARKGFELAQVNYQETKGKISAPEAINRRFEIEERYQRQAEMARFHAQEAELQAKRNHAAEVLKSATTTEREATAAKAEMDSAEQAWQRYQALMASSRDALKSTNEQIKALTGSKFFTPSMGQQLRAAWDLQAQLRTRLDVMEPEGAAYADRAAAARERWTKLSGSALGLRREATEAARTLPLEEAAAKERYVTEGREQNFNRGSRAFVAAGTLAKGASDAERELADAIEHGARIHEGMLSKLKEYTRVQRSIEVRIEQLERSTAREIRALRGR